MIKVTVGSNFNQKVVEADPSVDTIRQVLTDNGIDYNRFTVFLNGEVVRADMLDKTFTQNGVYENCYLTSTTKADSAAA